MGLDGGTKITRSDVLRGQSWRMAQQDSSRSSRGGSVNHVYQEKQLDGQVRRTALWTTCALSGLQLQLPIMADALGQLFNKQAVLEHLLAAKAAAAAQPAPEPAVLAAGTTAASGSSAVANIATGSIMPYSAPAAAAQDLAAACLRYENQQRAAAAAAAACGTPASLSATFDHIKSLKDVFLVQLTPNPDLQHAGNGTAAAPVQDSSGLQEVPSPWVCPVTLQPCGSKQPCSALKPCGHVLSHKALAAILPTSQHKKDKKKAPCAAAAAGTNSPGREQDEDLDGELSSCDVCCCPVCETTFDPQTDRVLINGSQQHMDAVRKQLQEAAAAKARAKQNKRKRAEAGQQAASKGALAGNEAKKLLRIDSRRPAAQLQ